jgi:hypothetical protein
VHRFDKASEVKGPYQGWSDKLKEGALGVLAILEGLDWDYVEYRVNKAKSLYPILLVIDEATWAALFYFIVAFAYAFVNYFLFNITSGPLYVFALASSVVLVVALTLAVTWSELVKTFKTLWSLDSLLWEVRWLYHEYRKLQT